MSKEVSYFLDKRDLLNLFRAIKAPKDDYDVYVHTCSDCQKREWNMYALETLDDFDLWHTYMDLKRKNLV